MKKIFLLLSSVFLVLGYSKENIQNEVIQKMDKKIENIYKMIEQAKEAKIKAPKAEKKIDTTTLPIMQGSFIIKKKNKIVKKEISALNPVNENFYYLNKRNNLIIQRINKDYVIYKINKTKVKSALVYNNIKDIPKPNTFNKYSTVILKKKGTLDVPSINQIIKNLKNK